MEFTCRPPQRAGRLWGQHHICAPRRRTYMRRLLKAGAYTALLWLTKGADAEHGGLRQLANACNLTKYEDWKTIDYGDNGGVISTNPFIWKYGPIQAQMTNGMALELSEKWCEKQLKQLVRDGSGQWGPVSDVSIRKTMCGTVCLESDRLRQEVMDLTKCNCLQLSTQPSSVYYHVEGDFCHGNSARILCRTLNRCDTWECGIEDFMCPRYCYNRVYVKWGMTGQCMSSARLSVEPVGSWVVAGLVLALTVYWQLGSNP